MTFQEAIKICFSKYADFSGRATRPEYWWWFLFVLLANAALSVLGRPLAGLFCVAVLLPGLAVGARRLHDIDKSAWWLLLALIPLIGPIVLLFLFAQPTVAQSRYA